MKHKFLEEMKEKITSARQAYTKVTEEKVKYRFGYDEIETNNRYIHNYELFTDKSVHKPSIFSQEEQFAPMQAQVRLSPAMPKAKGVVHIKKKVYDFKSISEFIYFNKESSKEDKTKQLKLQDIDKLETEEEFQRSYQDYQLSYEILQLFREVNSEGDDPDEDKDVLAGRKFVRNDR